jgi:hypothetical protein
MNFLKRIALYLLPLLIAFSTMIVVNEYSRSTIAESQRSSESLKMNSALATPDACTWKCFNDTTYCKEQHVKLTKNFFWLIDPFYFGIISALMMMGNYGAANILFLVLLWPLLLSYLLVKPVLIELQINNIRKRHV